MEPGPLSPPLEHPGLKPPGVIVPEHKVERGTRKPLAFWDRVKFLVLFGVIFGLVLKTKVDELPIDTFGDSLRETVNTLDWLLVLSGLEVMRQLHYVLSEHWAGWHGFWSNRVFGGWNRLVERFKPWTRYRVGRMFKWAVFVLVFAVFFSKVWNVGLIDAVAEAPTRISDFLFATDTQPPLIFQMLLIMGIAVGQFVLIFWFLSRGGTEVYFPDDIETRFSDVWGQDPVLARVKENVLYLEDPKAVEEKGGYVPGGILLWGPPGTGKTLMAEAVAGETGRPFVFVDPGAFINMFLGVGILKVKSLFRKLRKLALRYGGVIVFFDEADSLGNRGAAVGGMGGYKTAGDAAGVFSNAPACRGTSWLDPHALAVLQREAMAAHPNQAEQPRPGLVNRIIMGMGGGGGGMGTLQALLTEISGLKKPRGFFNRTVRRALNMRPKPPPKYRILVMMATNMPDVLDPALLRPGRIDRQYRVGYPSKDGRKRTYRGYFDKISNVISDEQLEKLAVMTPYATGASIKDLVNESLIVAIRNGRQTVTWPDVLAAKTLKALGPPEDVDYIERERHATALHEACHAIAGYRLRPNLAIDLATIEKGQTYLGMVSSVPIEEEFTDWGRDFDANIMVSLASLAGERMFFGGDNSSGVTGDLINATTLALRMESVWAMGETIGSHIVTKAPPTAQPIADGTDRNVLDTKIGEQVERRLQTLLERVRQLLENDRHHVLAITHALETTKTLSGEDIEAIIEGTEGPGIDGRMYHDPEFREELERYHVAAVEAHNRHGKVAIPLPRRHGLVPIPVTSSVLETPRPNGAGANGEGGTPLPPPPAPPRAPGAPPEWPEAPPTE